MEFVIGAFLLCVMLVCIFGTPYRSSAPRQTTAAPAAPQPQGQAQQPRTAQGQPTYGPPPPGHRWAIQNGQLVLQRTS